MLTIYEGKFTRLKDDRDNLIKAKEALELADPGERGVDHCVCVCVCVCSENLDSIHSEPAILDSNTERGGVIKSKRKGVCI